MTAEIAVLNRNAVALAADSAVTLRLPEGGTKIYQTNKLFTLSKYEPVGVMVYGSADFMGVPWETIVKRYRAHLGRNSFEELAEYGIDFLRFVEKNRAFFPAQHQHRHCNDWISMWLRRLTTRLKHALEEKLRSEGSQTERRVLKLFRELFDEEAVHLKKHRLLPSFSRTKPGSLLRKYRGAIRLAVKEELQKLADAVPSRRLENVAVQAIMRDLYWHNESGVVIAGFGSGEFFPGLRCYTLDSIVGGKLRGLEEKHRRTNITNENSAVVTAFAQSEMVSLFMNGIDDDYVEFVRSFVSQSMLVGYPNVLGNILESHLPASQRSRILKRLRGIGQQLVEALSSGIRQYAREMHSGPIVEIVNHLQKRNWRQWRRP